jgi:hypothetical protein
VTTRVDFEPPVDKASQRKALFWALTPVALLGLMLVGWTVMMTLAVRDPGFSLEPDYYKKALSWDAQQAQNGENARLGWRVEMNQVGVASAVVPAVFEIRLHDSKGVPIEGARASIEAFYNARASQRLSSDLAEGEAGQYRFALPIRHGGLWEFRLTVRRGTLTFTDIVRRDVGVVRH